MRDPVFAVVASSRNLAHDFSPIFLIMAYNLHRVKLLLLQQVTVLRGEVRKLSVGRLEVRRGHGFGNLLLQRTQLEGSLVLVSGIEM